MNEELETAQQSSNLCVIAIQEAHKKAAKEHPIVAILLRGMLEDARKINDRIAELASCMKDET